MRAVTRHVAAKLKASIKLIHSPSMQIMPSISALSLSPNSQAAAILMDHLLTIAMRNAAKFRWRHMLFWLQTDARDCRTHAASANLLHALSFLAARSRKSHPLIPASATAGGCHNYFK